MPFPSDLSLSNCPACGAAFIADGRLCCPDCRADSTGPLLSGAPARRVKGLVAIMAVGLGACVVIVLASVAVTSKASQHRTGPVAARSATAQVAPDAESALLAEVAGHSFWRVRPTAGRLLHVVDTIRSQPANTLAYIDDAGGLELSHTYRADGERQHPGFRPSTRHVMIDLATFEARPSRLDILQLLPGKLDRADFETPKGK